MAFLLNSQAQDVSGKYE